MPARFLDSVDLSQTQLLNALLQLLGSDPGTPSEGQIWYNTAIDRIKYRDNDSTETLANLSDLGGYQPLDGDLTTIAGLTATTDNVIQSVSGAWASRTPAQLKGTLALVKGDVGLGNVDNTSDADKPVSTAQASALALKANLASPTFTGTPAAPTATAGDNSTQIATTQFVQTAVSGGIAAADALRFRGGIDASANPNYPAADAGDLYRITVAGRIGGASGPQVEVGDTITAAADGLAAGNHAAVGASWIVTQTNIVGAATVDGNQTLTNKTISANDNTITNIGASEVVADIITGQTAETSIADGDEILIHDLSAGALRRMTKANFVAGLTGSIGKYSALVGNGALTTITITQATHGRAASRANTVQVLEESSGEVVYPGIAIAASGDVTLTFAVAPTSNQFRVTIVG